MKRFLLLFLLSFIQILAQAQLDTVPVYDDSTDMDELYLEEQSIADTFQKPIIRQISSDSLAALKRQKEFAYMAYADSFFRNQKSPLEQAVNESEEAADKTIFTNGALRTVYWLLAFVAVGWIIWRFFMGQSAVFRRNKKLHIPITEAANEPVPKEGIEAFIQRAIEEKNYRLAIRYLYLQTLSLLGQKNLLLLAPQKTNYQYLQELRGKKQEADFSKLTMQYEYAWYGGFQLSPARFESIYNSFQNFIQENT